MAIHRACMQAMALVAAMQAASPALAQATGGPSVRPGDEGHFVACHGTRSTVPSRIRHVVATSAQRIEATENGAPLALTPDLNGLDSPLRRDTNTWPLQIPLSVGQRRRHVIGMLFEDHGSTATTTAEVQVQAREEVRVAAGESDAFRMAASGRFDGRSCGGPVVPAGEFGSTSWYAPSVPAIVKSTSTSTYRGTALVELVEARLQR